MKNARDGGTVFAYVSVPAAGRKTGTQDVDGFRSFGRREGTKISE